MKWVRDGKSENQTIYANNDSSQTNIKSKNSSNNNNTNSNNNSDNIKDNITPTPSPSPSEKKSPINQGRMKKGNNLNCGGLYDRRTERG